MKQKKCNKISSIEIKFEKEILKVLKLKYQKQYFINETGKFYDFYLPDFDLFIEINGTYFHSDSRKYFNKTLLNEMQLKNKRNDKYKKDYCFKSNHHLIYIWENEINNKIDQIKIEFLIFIEFLKEINLKRKRPVFKNFIL